MGIALRHGVRAVVWGFVLGALAAQAHAMSRPTALQVDAPHHVSLTMSGDVHGLTPGTPGQLRVTLENPAGVSATVTRVGVDVLPPASRPGCLASHLRVAAYVGRVTVPARGRKVVVLPVRFAADLPAGCAGAAWRLGYHAH